MSAPIKARTSWNAATQGLWQIAETGEIGQLEQLLARGADVNASNNAGVTPLMVAAYHGQVEVVRALTDYGADPNAMDNDGFTAAMLADHSGYKEIARILVARSGKRIPRPSAYDTTSGLFAPVETFDRFSDADETSSATNPEVRTLHEPPDIWDLVHETREEFNPGSAFLGHFNSARPFLLILLALIAGGGVVYGVLNLTGGSTSSPAEPARTEARTLPAAPATLARNTAPRLDHARGVATSEPERSPLPAAAQTPAASPVGLAADASKLKKSLIALTEPDKRAAAKRRRTEQTTSNAPERTPLPSPANTGITDKAEKSTTPATKSDNAVPKPDSGKSADPAKKEEVKKESDKAPSPETAQPKANPTPKAKVINWP